MVITTSPITLRRHDLDNLRTSLTALVIAHHTALSFGGLGSWPYKSTSVPNIVSSLAAFNVFNQSFFMGLFFWISGRVSAQSLTRVKSRQIFVKAKLKRLVLPAVVYSVVLNPLVAVLALPKWNTALVCRTVVASVKSVRGARGSTWYLATLAVFDLVAVAFYSVPCPDAATTSSTSISTPSSTFAASSSSSWLDYRTVSAWGWIPIGLTCFAVRLWEPLGQRTPVIAVQLGYASQFVHAYVLGHMSHWQNEERMISPLDSNNIDNDNKGATSSRPSLAVASAISLSTMALMLSPALMAANGFEEKTGIINRMWGGWNMFAFSYAMWNELSFALMGPAIMAYFRRWHSSSPSSIESAKDDKRLVKNNKAAKGYINARNAYAAFLVHAPICVVVSRALDVAVYREVADMMHTALWRAIGPLVMTGAAGLLSVYGSFFVGGKMLELVPGIISIL